MLQFKKLSSFMFILFFVFTMIQIPIKKVQASENSNVVYVKIRYDRSDKNYDDWNIWTWEKGEDGKQVNFIGEDDKGKFAVIEVAKETKQLFVVIRNGNWIEKATGDEAIDLSNGDIEVLFTQGNDKAIREDKPLNRDFNTVKLDLHYYRFDGNYSSMKVSSWINKNDSLQYDFSKQDDYGKVAEITKANVKNPKMISFIIQKGDNSMNEKDVGKTRSIDLAYANNHGEINAYILQGDKNVYTDITEPVRNPEVTSLKIDSLYDMNFKLNSKIWTTDEIVLKESGNIINNNLYSINKDENSLDGNIKFSHPIDLEKNYSLEITRFKSANSSFGKIYGTKDFDNLYEFKGNLGALYNNDKTKFVLWAPTANRVSVALYGRNDKNFEPAEKIIDMHKEEKGIWTLEEPGNLDGVYYNYIVTIDGKQNEVTDPYAKAVGVNGKRGMVVNLSSTNPSGWNEDKRPTLKSASDCTIYEMHIRDFSIDSNSGINVNYRGKYNGVWQENTQIPGTDIKTGVAHLKDLGINTVHIMPAFDNKSIDETKLDTPQYNWGYDPQNYNVPEGSFSSNPYNGKIRIKEFKEMVNELHKQGIRVVMDVVYNHTGLTKDSLFNLAVPDYYYRQDANGNFSNGSGCGNELASERSMVRKLIIESVKHWASEYHIDGFRFDLMALSDIDTMKKVRDELNKIDKSILIYGEGWTGGSSSLPKDKQSLKANIPEFGQMQVAAFSDDLRDGLKGDVFNNAADSFVNGGSGFEESIKFGIVASTKHDGIDYSKVNYSKKPWANEPYQTINYASCHDNLTLWDRLKTTNQNKSDNELISMNKMVATVIFTSQGIPFIQGGEEFARTKVNDDGTFNENSYNALDKVNKIDWSRLEEYNDLNNYYKGLIQLRNSHKAFRMDKTKDIQENLKFLEKGKKFNSDNVIGYTLNGKNVGDSWNKITVIFNSSNKDVQVTLPSEDWVVVVNGDKAGTKKLEDIKGSSITVLAHTSYVLVDSNSFKSEN